MKKYSAYSSKRQTNPEEVLRIYTETDLCYGICVLWNFSDYEQFLSPTIWIPK